MSSNRNMVLATGIAERVQAGCSPPLRRRRTRDYIPNSRSRQRAVNEHSLHDMNLFSDEDLTFGIRDSSAPLYKDENMNSLGTHGPSPSDRQPQLHDILRVVPDNSHLSERYQILKAENKILRERLQNALQRELKALKTFKRLAKENRQLKLNLRKYERTLLGFYDDESDSDQSELYKGTELSDVHKEQATGKQLKRKPKELANSDEYLDDQDWRQNSPAVRTTTRTASTSTEDIRRKFTEDKSTSTDELESIELKSQSEISTSTLSDPENHKDHAESKHEVNLTDANKVQLLHNQLMAIQNQSVQERRKFSETRRYWTDTTISNNLGVNELQRALSSPSLLDGCRESSSDSDASSVRRRRSSEGSSPRSPSFISRSRPPSFNDAELSTVPEVTISNDVTDGNEDSSGSCSPSSGHSQEELGLSSSSPVPSLSNGENVISQSSPRASPLTLTSVFNSRQTDVFPELDPSPSPQTSPAASPRMSRRKLGHTVSLPTASFHRYLQEHQTENRAAIIAEDLGKRRLRQPRRKSIDDDEIYVKKNRQTSVSLRFEGDIERENAETLAADIAEFLERRQSRNRADTMPIDSFKETKKEMDIPEENGGTSSAQSRSLRARRGSAVVSLPGDHYQMDLHVLNVLEGSMESKNQLSVIREKKELSGSSISLNSIDPEKRSRWSILRRNKKLLLLKDKQEKLRQGEDFREVLARMKENPRPTVEHELSKYKNSHWTQLMGNGAKQNPRRPLSEGETTLSDHETKRREAVWELFHSEVIYLTGHLLVLKEVFLQPLLEIHQMGHLQYVNADKIFCNLQDLCEVSTKFAKNLLLVFRSEKPTQFGSTAAVVSAFTEFSWRVHPQYQKYCLNYSKALSYLDSLKKYEDFQEFTKWCEADIRCNRLQLTDLLVAPLQHLTKYPLLLKNIRKRTSEGDDQHGSLSFIIKSVELSIQELEGKVKSRANYERLQELQSTLVWPPITELDPKTYIPEFLKGILSKQPCESLLASPKRQLLYEGPLTLIENAKMDVYAFLFDDMLLLTKSRKFVQKATKQKLSLSGIAADSPPTTPPAVRRTMPGVQYSVYKQPIPLDRFIIIDAEATPAGSTLKNTFIIIHYSRFKQTVGLYTLQAPSQNLKETWTSTLKAAQSKWSEAVALELAAETENLNSIHTINETPAEQEAVPESPDDTAMTQTQMLSYYKPIESQC